MSRPLVTVICLCYNHARFVAEAIDSVFNQTYPEVELIVVDDASTDGSQQIVREKLKDHPGVVFLALPENLGNCRAFNLAWRQSKGEFIIDLAADDVLLPHRVEKGVSSFLQKGPTYGVQFSDALVMDENGKHLGLHSDKYPHHTIPEGDVYQSVISRYFINGPSTMVRRSVLVELNGYDESLHYEDFDFWVRSSRVFRYFYIPEPLVKQRKVPNSMSVNQFRRGSAQQESTYHICLKIKVLNRTEGERKALNGRVRYELIQSVRRGDFSLAWRYFMLWLGN